MSIQTNALKYLFISEFVQRFSYYGIQSFLILYFLKVFSMSSSLAYTTYGAFTALSFITSILGGLLADKWFGFRKLALFGLILSLIGNAILAICIKPLLIFGLALIIFGIGSFFPTNANFLGTFYEIDNAHRAKDFTIFYIGTNIGALSGPIIYGILSTYNWNYPFALTALLMSSWLLLYWKNRDIFKNYGLPPKIESSKNNRKFTLLIYLGILSILALSILLLKNPSWVGKLLIIAAIISLLMIVVHGLRKPSLERNQILVLILMIVCALLFFACAFQTYTSLLVFINQHVNRQFLNWEIPSSTFSALEPLFIVLISPVAANFWKYLTYRKKDPLPLSKLAIGLGFAGCGFGIFALSACFAKGNAQSVSVLWIFGGNLFLGLGEICIMPILIATITQLAPARMKGTLMGLLYFSLAFSGYFAGIIGKLTMGNNQYTSSLIYYFNVYIKICYLAFILAITVYGISLWLKRNYANILPSNEEVITM